MASRTRCPKLPEFREFQEGLKGWVAEPSVAGPATVVGSYRVQA
jgi:hypothetical protein